MYVLKMTVFVLRLSRLKVIFDGPNVALLFAVVGNLMLKQMPKPHPE